MSPTRKSKLIKEWAKSDARCQKIREELKQEYLKNPIDCEECGRSLVWDDYSKSISVNGLSLQMCDCMEDMK